MTRNERLAASPSKPNMRLTLLHLTSAAFVSRRNPNRIDSEYEIKVLEAMTQTGTRDLASTPLEHLAG